MAVDNHVAGEQNTFQKFIANESVNGKCPEKSGICQEQSRGRTTCDKPNGNSVEVKKRSRMKEADDSYSKKARLLILSKTLWLGCLGMLAAAITIVLFPLSSSSGSYQPKLHWWQTAIVYDMPPGSFRDSNGDGMGDFKGIIQNLDYLEGKAYSLNVTAVQFDPIFPHGNVNNRYDVTDFYGITPEYGTMDDFDNLRDAVHKRNMKMIISFLPNHSSHKHPWFVESVKKTGKYADYYVWHPGRDGGKLPPNNWQAMREDASAWTYHPEREEYYLGQFSHTRPDLNAYNPAVQKEYEAILKFWLKKGVDGFNAEGISRLFECTDLTDEALLDPNGPLTYFNMDHDCSQNQPESFEIVTRWRKIIDDYATSKGKDILLFVRTNLEMTNSTTAQWYEYEGKKGVHMTAANSLYSVKEGCEAQCVYGEINKWIPSEPPRDFWSNWNIGNSHFGRVVSRFKGDRTVVNAMNLLHMTLPGTIYKYYGEEIGMRNLDKNSCDVTMTLGITSRLLYNGPHNLSLVSQEGTLPGFLFLMTTGNITSRLKCLKVDVQVICRPTRTTPSYVRSLQSSGAQWRWLLLITYCFTYAKLMAFLDSSSPSTLGPRSRRWISREMILYTPRFLQLALWLQTLPILSQDLAWTLALKLT